MYLSNSALDIGNKNCISDGGLQLKWHILVHMVLITMKINLIDLKEEKAFYSKTKKESEKIISD